MPVRARSSPVCAGYITGMCGAHAGYITGQNLLLDGGAYPGTL